VPEESTFFATAFVEARSTSNAPSDGDLWPCAWADDDFVYAANGDGAGFDPAGGWSDIVVSRLSGHPDAEGVRGTRLASGDALGQVWSDPARYNRKPTGMLAVDGVLYLAVQDLRSEPGPLIFNDAPAATILRSEDGGRTWVWDTRRPMFDSYTFTTIMFLDYGRGGADNTFDGYVYAYGLDHNWRDSFSDTVPDPTQLFLARVPRDRVLEREHWEFFRGLHVDCPVWTSDIAEKQPVLRDERRRYTDTLLPIQPSHMSVLSQGGVVYNRPLRRYLYTSWTEFTFEFYEAPTPWGPWKCFLSRDFGSYPWSPHSHGGYGTVIPSRYISADGMTMWVNANTFVGGIRNYGLSLRRLQVTPYVESAPANEPGPWNLALPAYGRDVTPISQATFRLGNVAFLNNGNRRESEDSHNGERKGVDYWGYTWSHAYHLDTVVYTSGDMFGAEGGWFDDIRVQVRQHFAWVDVDHLTSAPAYPCDASAGPYKTYTFRFEPTWGDGVRIIGTPGGTATCTSFAELEAYYRGE
jgi:hypothetical protein